MSAASKTRPYVWPGSLDIFCEARIAHQIPGRIRISFSKISDASRIEEALLAVGGVNSAQVNPVTGSVLIQYEERHVDAKTLFHLACGAQFGHVEPLGTDGSFTGFRSVSDAEAAPLYKLPTLKVDHSRRTGDVFRIGLELLVGIIAADMGAVLACLVAAAVAKRGDQLLD